MTSVDPTTAPPKLGRLLIVDDEIKLMTALVNTLAEQGYETTGVNSAAEALEVLRRREFDILLTDMQMSEMDGMALLSAVQGIDPHLVAIMMTGHATVQTAVEAMKLGAFDYVQKPLKLRDLLPVLARAMEVHRLREENMHLREAVGIHELSVAIGFSLDADTILRKAMDAALKLCGGDEVSILLPTADDTALVVAAVVGERREKLLNQRIAKDDGIAGWVMRNHEAVILNGPVSDPRFAPLYPRAEIFAAIAVPMMVGGRCVGVLNVNATQPRRPFTLGQVKALTILTGTAAPALQAATLYRQVHAAKEEWEQSFNAIEDLVCIVDRAGKILRANKAMRDRFELVHGNLIGLDYRLPYFGTPTPDPAPACAAVLENGSSVKYESILPAIEGWYSVTSYPLFDSSREQWGAVSIVRNISERKQAEIALRESEQHFRTFMDNSPALAFIKDEQGSYLYVSHPPQWYFAKKPDEWLRKTDYDLWPREIGDAVRKNDLSVLASGNLLQVEETAPGANGAPTYWLSFKFPLVHLTGQRLVGGVAINITAHKHTEQMLRQAQKMKAFGQLAGGVAHDFNNLLTIITGYSELILNGLVSAPEKQRELLREIRKAGERATALTRQLLAFSRKQMLQSVVLDLNTLVGDMEKMLRPLIGEDIDLAIMLDPALTKIKADPGQIEQVIMNLIVNARDAMPTGGHLTVETRNVELDAEYAAQHPEIQPGHYVLLAVTDSGSGMEESIRAKIFEPFFTTKEIGKGTGLGLATVHGIVKQSGGSIEVYSEPGQGTTFKIYLPSISAPAASGHAATGLPNVPRGSETILLAEDEEAVRAIVRLALEAHGYTVLAAENGDEALQFCKDFRGPIDLLMTDVVMPKLSGRQLAGLVVDLRPAIKVLYLSGYTDDAIVRHGVLEAGMAFLQKPFTPMSLARKVREVLDKAPSS